RQLGTRAHQRGLGRALLERAQCRRVPPQAKVGESEDDRAQKPVHLDLLTRWPLLLAERPSAREIPHVRQQPRRLIPKPACPAAMPVSLGHLPSVAEDNTQLPPFAEV